VLDALTMLRNMDHRGACGCEANTGDGAGIQTCIPDAFMRKTVLRELGIDLPEPGRYGVGNIFLPTHPGHRAYCKQQLEYFIAQQGQHLLGWRPLPTNADEANIGLPCFEYLTSEMASITPTIWPHSSRSATRNSKYLLIESSITNSTNT